MDLYSEYKSPFGYETGTNGIDSYGVDHSRFSIRDELEYQTARAEREKQLMQQFNKQGITDNYPQYSTNFWGDAGNNYGFGSSNIGQNIQNVTNRLNNGGFVNSHRFSITNPTQNLNSPNYYTNNNHMQNITAENSYTTESAWGYPNNTQSPYYQKMGKPYNIKPEPQYQIGTLSASMESNGGKHLWNNGNLDKTGGWSYGTYQIATKNGTMNDYLTHLQKNPNYQSYYNTLQQVGGYNAALIGDEQFKNAWTDLSNDKNFLQSQQDFIIDKKLNPAIRYVNDIKGLDFDKRSPVVRDVMFSTATQHGEGGARDIFHNALGYDASNLTDEDIINKIYQERGNVGKYFRNSTKNYQNNLKNNRFEPENVRALELLKKYP